MREKVSGWIWGVAALTAIALLSACSTVPPPRSSLPSAPAKASYKLVSFADFKGWSDGDPVPAFAAYLRSCQKISALPADQTYGPTVLATHVSDWQAACAAAAQIKVPDAASVRRFFEQNFRPLSVALGSDADGLFTGYYEPEIRASRTCGGKFKSPLYRRPPNMVTVNLGLFRQDLENQQIVGKVRDGKLIPFDTRKAIDNGSLAGKGLELACAADPVDSFFLEIQGSGRLLLDDGRVQQIGYDGKNGHAYIAIGRELVRLGELAIENVTLQSIRAWLAAHPERVKSILESNPSYVFFREISGDYAIGAEGVELTPGHSLAVDRSFLPLGAPVWLETDLPDIDASGVERPLRRLMVAQDTGGAIKGAVRGDVFWGAGSEAAKLAGAMKQRGRYFILVPRAAALAAR